MKHGDVFVDDDEPEVDPLRLGNGQRATEKQQRLARALLDPEVKSKAQAARIAGYKGGDANDARRVGVVKSVEAHRDRAGRILSKSMGIIDQELDHRTGDYALRAAYTSAVVIEKTGGPADPVETADLTEGQWRTLYRRLMRRAYMLGHAAAMIGDHGAYDRYRENGAAFDRRHLNSPRFSPQSTPQTPQLEDDGRTLEAHVLSKEDVRVPARPRLRADGGAGAQAQPPGVGPIAGQGSTTGHPSQFSTPSPSTQTIDPTAVTIPAAAAKAGENQPNPAPSQAGSYVHISEPPYTFDPSQSASPVTFVDGRILPGLTSESAPIDKPVDLYQPVNTSAPTENYRADAPVLRVDSSQHPAPPHPGSSLDPQSLRGGASLLPSLTGVLPSARSSPSVEDGTFESSSPVDQLLARAAPLMADGAVASTGDSSLPVGGALDRSPGAHLDNSQPAPPTSEDEFDLSMFTPEPLPIPVGALK